MRAALHLRLIRLRAGGFDHLAPPLQFASYSESSGAESIPPDSAALHPGFCDFWISERARLTTLEPTKLRIPGFASERRSIACVLFVIYVWYDVWHAKDYRLHSRGRETGPWPGGRRTRGERSRIDSRSPAHAHFANYSSASPPAFVQERKAQACRTR